MAKERLNGIQEAVSSILSSSIRNLGVTMKIVSPLITL